MTKVIKRMNTCLGELEVISAIAEARPALGDCVDLPLCYHLIRLYDNTYVIYSGHKYHDCGIYSYVYIDHSGIVKVSDVDNGDWIARIGQAKPCFMRAILLVIYAQIGAYFKW